MASAAPVGWINCVKIIWAIAGSAGGVPINYHSLSDFRIAHQAVLDQLLARGVASLVEAGLVSLDTLAQDGLRVRASAGTGSFRRRKRLEELRTASQARVAR